MVGGGLDAQKSLQQRPKMIEPKSIGTIRFGVRRVIMNLKEETVDSGSDGCSGQKRNELRLASGDAVGSRGGLHRVGTVEDDRRQLAHDGQRTHIDDQVVVAEGGSAF